MGFKMSKAKILFEDKDLVAAHKPSGWTVYPESGAQGGDLQTWLKTRVKGLPAGGTVLPVHRLDRGTCGIVIYGKNQLAAQRLKQVFLKRGALKKYWALVCGMPSAETGSFRSPLKNNEGKEESALTRYTLLGSENQKELGDISLLELEPKTGRFHQIRKHLKGAGLPIIGDPDYGRKKINDWAFAHWKIDRTLLSAVYLELTHPMTQKKLRIETKPDSDFLKLIGE
jgi:tRNA pseudouridine65 synthase